jgi:hypothetical protein
MIMPHQLRVEARDGLGRAWCLICGLPASNARAREAHERALEGRAPDARELAAADGERR